MNAPVAVFRFPRTSAQATGRDVVTGPTGIAVMTLHVTARGRQVDLSAPDGRPLGRIVEIRRQHWQLIAPGTGLPVADADVSLGIRVRIGAGPAATVEGRGEEWDLVWEHSTLLAARKTSRRVEKQSLEVTVGDPACTPAVVAFVVHVRRWAQSAQLPTG